MCFRNSNPNSCHNNFLLKVILLSPFHNWKTEASVSYNVGESLDSTLGNWIQSPCPFYKNNFIYLFWALLGLHCCVGFSLVVASGGYLCSSRASHCSVFCCWGTWAPGAGASGVVSQELCSCSPHALENRLKSCGPWARWLLGLWALPGSEIEPVSPALAGKFLTTEQSLEAPRVHALDQVLICLRVSRNSLLLGYHLQPASVLT